MVCSDFAEVAAEQCEGGEALGVFGWHFQVGARAAEGSVRLR